ncbi:MAG: hypothetical protein Q9213_005726 [Squamulea squamosa]
MTAAGTVALDVIEISSNLFVRIGGTKTQSHDSVTRVPPLIRKRPAKPRRKVRLVGLTSQQVHLLRETGLRVTAAGSSIWTLPALVFEEPEIEYQGARQNSNTPFTTTLSDGEEKGELEEGDEVEDDDGSIEEETAKDVDVVEVEGLDLVVVLEIGVDAGVEFVGLGVDVGTDVRKGVNVKEVEAEIEVEVEAVETEVMKVDKGVEIDELVE